MAKKKIQAPEAARRVEGLRVLATLADGWRATFLQDDLVLVHPEYAPRLVRVASINEGDVLPREIDETVSFPPIIGGN